jgi:hypothetical protein
METEQLRLKRHGIEIAVAQHTNNMNSIRNILIALSVLLGIDSFGSPLIELPIEMIEKCATHIVILVPDKFTITNSGEWTVAKYKYSKIIFLKGNST